MFTECNIIKFGNTQSRSDGSTVSGGISNLSTITIATDADMDGIILDEGDEESAVTDSDSNSLEMKTNTNIHSVHPFQYRNDGDDGEEDSNGNLNGTRTRTQTQTQEYTLMRHKYQNAPQLTYDDRRSSMSSSAKMITSLKLKFDNTSSKIKKKIKRRNSWSNIVHRRRKVKRKKKPDIVHKFLPIMLKLSILSAWCAFSTFGLGFGLWTIYPTLSSVIDSTINALCVYLSFGFAKTLYECLCSPFISCRNCEDYRNVVKEANKMEKDKDFEMEDTVLG